MRVCKIKTSAGKRGILYDDWIDDVIKHIIRNRNERQVVLWGKCEAADTIKTRLKDEYGIEVAFYVVGRSWSKYNDVMVKPSVCLEGKSADYYVAIPLSFHPSIKEALLAYGFQKDVDYYYFCDCVIEQRDDYYEDSHGNKLIGRCAGLKFAFLGFGATLEVGKNVTFQGTTIYLNSGARVSIGDECSIIETWMWMRRNGIFSVKKNGMIKKSTVNVYENSVVKIGSNCVFFQGSLSAMCNVEIGKNIKMRECILATGIGAKVNIGDGFTMEHNGVIDIANHTSLSIGNDCMFSWYVFLLSGDMHTIFDVATKININSTPEISKSRKIKIGNHVWVGAGASILYGSEIDDGSIIGAESLVKGKIPNNCIAAGNPAKIIRRSVAWSRGDGDDDISECGEAYTRMTEDSI